MPRRDPLQRLELFGACTPSQVRRIRSLLTMLTVDPGTVLMREGAYGFECVIITDGLAEVTVGGRVVATLGAGDVVGEMSLLGGDARTATVVAVTPLTFYVCNAAEFAGMLELAPEFAAQVRRTADERRRANEGLAPAA